MYDRILLPTDGSAGMARVIDHAAELARRHDAAIRGLYVLDTASLNNLPLETSIETLTTELRAEGEQALDGVAERLPAGVDLERELIEGSPAREIVDHARTEPCDIVVMGTHGRSGVDRLLLGSVAERVVRRSPVPVLTVRVDAAGADGDAR